MYRLSVLPLEQPLERMVNPMLLFLAGLMLGGMVGVFVMCLLQINREE